MLELGCGTGRVSMPLARAGVDLVGIDRSAPMLAAGASQRKSPTSPSRRILCAGPRRHPRACRSRPRRFSMVLAPYGILQSLIDDRAISRRRSRRSRASSSAAAPSASISCRTSRSGASTRNRVQLRGRCAAAPISRSIESVRQDRRRRLTTFEQRYVERRGGRTREHRFELTFRTLSVPQMTRAARTRRVPRRGRARRLPRTALGRARRRLDHPGATRKPGDNIVARLSVVHFSLFLGFLEF